MEASLGVIIGTIRHSSNATGVDPPYRGSAVRTPYYGQFSISFLILRFFAARKFKYTDKKRFKWEGVKEIHIPHPVSLSAPSVGLD